MKTPTPYLSVVHSDEGPTLVLTVDADALNVCPQCPHLHVLVLNEIATPDVIRKFAAQVREWADRLEAR